MKTIVIVKFDAGKIPGGADAILEPSRCGNDVAIRTEYTINDYFEQRTGTDVKLTLDETDSRVSQVLALLTSYGERYWLDRKDVYTEDELQAAPLLVLRPWQDRSVGGAVRCGTTYDMSHVCPRCGGGARQTSTLIVDDEDLRKVEKTRIAATYHDEFLLHDIDVELLLGAQITGALFWPVQAKTKAGTIMETRRQQLFVEHVMPPMAPSSLLDRTKVCSVCHRSGFINVPDHPLRYAYRREDLKNIQDVNLSWELIGEYDDHHYDLVNVRWPDPEVLITPKVMNLLRSTKKKDAKYQGAYFIPIWIED